MDGLIALFLLPVFAGYLVLTKTRLYSVRTNTYSMPRLFAKSLVAGIGLLYLSSLVIPLYHFNWHFPEFRWDTIRGLIWNGIIWPVKNEIDNAQGKKGITDPAMLCVILAWGYVVTEGCLTDEMNVRLENLLLIGPLFKWLHTRHARQILDERDRVGGSIERLFALSMNTFTPVQITMKSRKVYVAIIKDLPTLSPVIKQQRFVNILPIRSGYRDSDTLTVELKITDYAMIFDLILMQGGVSPANKAYAKRLQTILKAADRKILENLSIGIAIDSDEIVSVSLWDNNIFNAFKAAEKQKKAHTKKTGP